MTVSEKSEKDNDQGTRKSSSAVNDKPGSLLALVRFREALDRTDMPATAQKIGGFIVRKFNAERGYAWPTIARIAFECSCSEATVYRAIQEKDGPLRQWFKVGKIVIDGEERNTYTPDWEKAAAVNREFDIRLEEWNKAQTEKRAEQRLADSDSQNERSRSRKMRGGDLSKCETIDLSGQNLADRSYVIPEHSVSGTSARSSRRGRACGADRPAYKQTKAQADAILAEIKSVWPRPSEDAEYQPGPDSAKAEAVHWYSYLKSGVAASRIQRAALRYLSDVPEDQWPRSFVSFLTGRLADYLDPGQPDLFISEDELPPPAEPLHTNDNQQSSQRMAS
ncbi:helix-turn-helix domain-containing protein [Bradyrhizobium diazoefficiens]|uniref:helix-turn-helix domain-containing protein n=1 Tax=Bradyrhizobium diazoefficiens TaxID=1355477 RepID=UPI0027149795|nr:helix-turn-helix domain-containing protein [Bradyrhizobium diazoefficiens]WLB42297.1 helix-turn-helix domain-containing protein [Bradyrhizobium diazoefficiens]